MSVELDTEYTDRLDGWSDIIDHLPTLHATVLKYPQAQVLELGVRSGNSTAALLAAVDTVDGHLTSVDVHPPQVPAWWHTCGRWTLRLGDDSDPFLAGQLPLLVDVLFVDTSHHYEHTLAELRMYIPRVKPGGVALFHDTELETPDGYRGDPFPVARALDDYCEETGHTWVNTTGCYGLGTLMIGGSP